MQLKPNEGQAQILAIIVLANVMLAMLLGVMEYTQQVRLRSIQESRVTEMRRALDGAHRMLLQLYREGVCDPVALNNKINFLDTDGKQTDVTGRRQVQFMVNGHRYEVSIGPLSRLAWALFEDPSFPADGPGLGQDIVGISQDVVIEVWTHFGNTRVTQKATLINDCQYPCAYVYEGALNPKMGMCAVPSDPNIGYHIVNPTGSFSPDTDAALVNSNTVALTIGGQIAGNVSIPIGGSCTTASNEPDAATGTFVGPARLDVRDLVVLREYLRSGGKDATCPARVQATDLNVDGVVNENDLVLFQKFLRGYIYQIPVSLSTRYK